MTDSVNNQPKQPNYVLYGAGGAAVGAGAGLAAKGLAPVKLPEFEDDKFDASSKKAKVIEEAVNAQVKASAEESDALEKVFASTDDSVKNYAKGVADAKLPEKLPEGITKESIDAAKSSFAQAQKAATENVVADLKTDNELAKLLQTGKLTETVDGKEVAKELTEDQKAVTANKDAIVKFVKGEKDAVLPDSVKGYEEQAKALKTEAEKLLSEGGIIERAKNTAKKSTDDIASILTDDKKALSWDKVKTVFAEAKKGVAEGADDAAKKAAKAVADTAENFKGTATKALKSARKAPVWAGIAAGVGLVAGAAAAMLTGKAPKAEKAEEKTEEAKA